MPNINTIFIEAEYKFLQRIKRITNRKNWHDTIKVWANHYYHNYLLNKEKGGKSK